MNPPTRPGCSVPRDGSADLLLNATVGGRGQFRIASILTALLAIAAVASAHTNSNIDRTFTVADGGRLVIDADRGDVEITPGASGRVEIHLIRVIRSGSKSESEEILKRFEVQFSQEQTAVSVKLRYHDGALNFFHWMDVADVRFVVRVPRRFNLDVHTSGGAIDVGELQGTVKGRTSGGAIKLGQIDGTVDIDTSGGAIDVAGATSRLTAHTSGGGIRIGSAGADVEARSSGGSIAINHAVGSVLARTSGGGIQIEGAGGPIDATTSGGSVSVRLTSQPRGETRLTTSGGGISLALAADASAEVDAHASGGDIDSEIALTVSGSQERSSLRGSINRGGPRLLLRTSGGDIRLKKL
jgi:hypothetical protein